MWSPEEQKALESSDKNTHGVPSTHHHSFGSVPASWRTSEQSLEHTKRQRVSLNDSAWPSSASGSTVTEHEHSVATPRGQTDVEAVVPSKPSPVKFWSQSLKTTRRRVFRKYAVTLFVLCIFVLGVLSIYWGALFQIKANLRNATIAVVDFDEDIVGPFVVEAVRSVASAPDSLGYAIQKPAQYNSDPLAVRRAVHNDELWGAIIINANATALLRSAVEYGNTSYDALGACQLIYNQARDVEAENQYIIPVLISLASSISNDFGRYWTEQVLTNTSLSPAIYATTPQALSPAIDFTKYNLRPFDPPVATPAVSIGLIYLIIIAFFSFSFFMPIHALFLQPGSPPNAHPPLKFAHLLTFRYVATITAYFFLSFAYSLVSLCFLIPFSNTPTPPATTFSPEQSISNANLLGHATWPVYWALNFVGITALGLPLEVTASLLPAVLPSSIASQPWTSLVLIFWVITNVSTGFYALELAPGFYRWGYGWPLRQIVMGSRALLFGTRDELGWNFGVLGMWVVGCTGAWWVVGWWVWWRKGRKAAKSAREAAAGGVSTLRTEK